MVGEAEMNFDEYKFNCRDIADFLDIGLQSARRYCLKFIGFHEGPGIHTGVERYITADDCFIVFMGVKLIQDAKFTLKEACKIVEFRGPWLKLYHPGKLEFKFGLAEISFDVEAAVELFKNKVSEINGKRR